ncbi:PIG-P-domain-containing protein [Dichomitus squalens]|uniref:PIG-P-domain-containing protein n=1 Tax=Dichomitus squalens TaxID=114155 RepID=A0A4Q9PE39_9APHY|nr:PIG-P-domain-containing protein [Dichomitus squalens]
MCPGSSERPDKPAAADPVVMSETDADLSTSSANGCNPDSKLQTLSSTPSEMASDSDMDSGSELVYYRHGHGHSAQTREDEPTSPTSPLAPYPPLAPTESRSRAPEFYGFVAWTSTYLLFVLYLLWAFLPDETIVALGVAWYPNREWSLLIPAYGMVLVLLTYFTYFALALAGTPSFADMRTITDSKAHFPARPSADDTDDTDTHASHNDETDAIPRLGSSDPASHLRHTQSPSHSPQNPKRRGGSAQPNPYLAHAQPGAIPELYDIPLGLVNRVVYGRRPAVAAAACSPP